MKETIYTTIGIIGAFFASIFGGYSTGIKILAILMIIDYITGIILAGVFHKSKKNKGGRLESAAGFKGIVKKGVMLLIVFVSHEIDTLIGTKFVQDATVIAFTVNEITSIIENAGLMGVPIPKTITDAIEVLRQKSEKEGK